MAHPAKGSPAAMAWAAKMQAARKKKGGARKKAGIRESGRKLEEQFFGPGGEVQQSFYRGLQKERREHPEKFIAGMPRKNPKGDYTGVLKLPFYIERAVAFVLHDGPRVLDWEWDRRMSPENKKHFHDFLVSVHHPLAYEAGTPEQRYKRFILEYVMPRIEKNPKDFPNIEKSGFHRGEYVGYGGGVWRIVRYGKGWNAGRQGEPREHFTASTLEEVSKILTTKAEKKNPGESWHKGMEQAAGHYGRRSREPLERAMYKGIEVAHRDSATAARRLGMNPRKERTIRPRHSKNPLAVFGFPNPPKSVNVSVAGVLYSRCLEIRAEKLKYKPGLYKHPFTRKAGVQILALDSGDLLVHSTRRVNLWKPA